MSGGRKLPALMVICATVVGLGIGEALVRGPLAPPRKLLLFVRSPALPNHTPPVSLSGGTRGNGAAVSERDGANASPDLSTNTPKAPEWLPQDHSDPERRGAAGAQVLQASQWHRQARTRPYAVSKEESAVLEMLHQDMLAALRDDAELTDGLGPAPWEKATFRVAGTLRRQTGPNLLIPGRDFVPDASPEASLAWYEASYGRRLSSSALEVGLKLLREYETEKRKMLVALVDAIAARLNASSTEVDADAFLLTAAGLVLRRRSEDVALDAAFQDLQIADEDAVQAFKDILR